MSFATREGARLARPDGFSLHFNAETDGVRAAGTSATASGQAMRRDPIKSAARTLEVLELFHEQRAPLRLKYIFEKLSYPQSSTTSLLKSMVVLGYLNYDRPSRTYFPTPRVAAPQDHHLHQVGAQRGGGSIGVIRHIAPRRHHHLDQPGEDHANH